MADTTGEFKEIVMEHPDNGSRQAVSDIADYQRLAAYGWTEAKATKTAAKSTKTAAKTADEPTTNAEAVAPDTK